MAEPFFRMMEILVPSIVAANGNKITFEGLENIPERGGALIALNHTSYVDWVPASIAAHHRRRRLRFSTGCRGGWAAARRRWRSPGSSESLNWRSGGKSADTTA